MDDVSRPSLAVFLTGGTGFIGRHIARRLVERGHRVHALVRNPRAALVLRDLGAELVEGDITRPSTLSGAIDGCDSVIHLVGIIRERAPAVSFRSVHVAGTEHVLDEAVRAGVRKFVHMSALGARSGGTPYHTTKFEAEEAVRSSGIGHVILRPSIVVGPGSEFIKILHRVLRLLPATPVIGDGQYRLQPVDVEDVASAFTLAAERDDLENESFDIAGPHKLTYNRVLGIMCEELGIRRLRVHVPLSLVRPGVNVIERLGLPAPINSDELAMLLDENVVGDDGNALKRVFGLEPTPFRAVLQRIKESAGR